MSYCEFDISDFGYFKVTNKATGEVHFIFGGFYQELTMIRYFQNAFNLGHDEVEVEWLGEMSK